jgi:hypothetical protein
MVLISDILSSRCVCGHVASVQPGVARRLFPANAALAIVYDLETIMGDSEDINEQVTNATQG